MYPNFDEILEELSYRVGIVDLTNKSHKQILVKLLRERGIAYAPDFLINAGGIINVYGEIVKYGKDQAMKMTENIYNTTLEIFNFAEVNNMTTQQAAMQIAQNRIDQRKKENAAQ
jgi:leucine dehydrogenase